MDRYVIWPHFKQYDIGGKREIGDECLKLPIINYAYAHLWIITLIHTAPFFNSFSASACEIFKRGQSSPFL